jgi:hypothetical protein
VIAATNGWRARTARTLGSTARTGDVDYDLADPGADRPVRASPLAAGTIAVVRRDA